MKTKEKRERRFKLITDARALLDAAETAGRDLNAEERSQYDTMLADAETLRSAITREERQAELEREMLEERSRQRGEPEQRGDGDRPQDGVDGNADLIPDELRGSRWAQRSYRIAYRSYLKNGISGMSGREARDLDATQNDVGGFLRAPIQLVNTLIKKVDDLVFIRGLATKYTVASAASLGVPTLASDPDDTDWTAELATGSKDTGMKFGRRELYPYPLAKRILISNKLLRSATMDVESIVMDRMAYKRAIVQEKAFLTGSGVNQPLGLFTVANTNDGITTARDVTAAANNALAFDDLYNAKYNMKAQYWARMRWLFHRDALKQIAKLKDGMNRYLWEPSTQVGQPDLLLGIPFMMSEYVPNTFTTGKYVGIIGDFSWYWIADSLDLQIQRLVELYAESNQTGFIFRQETDGMPVLEEAFTRIKLA